MLNDVKDINLRYQGHPKYVSSKLEEDLPIEVITQKLEMILYTNKGEVLSDPDLGVNLEYYLWSTSVPMDFIKMEIASQVAKYIPELVSMGYSLDLQIYKGTERDILYININLSDKNINFIFQ